MRWREDEDKMKIAEGWYPQWKWRTGWWSFIAWERTKNMNKPDKDEKWGRVRVLEQPKKGEGEIKWKGVVYGY